MAIVLCQFYHYSAGLPVVRVGVRVSRRLGYRYEIPDQCSAVIVVGHLVAAVPVKLKSLGGQLKSMPDYVGSRNFNSIPDHPDFPDQTDGRCQFLRNKLRLLGFLWCLTGRTNSVGGSVKRGVAKPASLRDLIKNIS